MMGREPMPQQKADVRAHNYQEVNLGYTTLQAQQEASRCLNCKNPLCVSGCPVGVRIPEFIGQIKQGNVLAAAGILQETNRLPGVCGRVCPQEEQCEKRCVLGIKGESVAIGNLERFASDYARQHGEKAAKEAGSKGKKVAVVGSGPAGLTCAGDLCALGYDVTIFEALHSPGGVLMYGIPEFRLPKELVRAEVQTLLDMGVTMEFNVVVGRTVSVDELQDEGFEAFFLGTGAGLPKFMGIAGEDYAGVYAANEFLTRINLMGAYKEGSPTPLKRGHKVAVVGGGNVAMDAARCALRLGGEVTLVYRRTVHEMPARKEEIHHAIEEGVSILELTSPIEVLGDDKGQVIGLSCLKCELGQPDASGRRSPKEMDGSEFTLPCDQVIMAIGTSPNPLLYTMTKGLEVNPRGCLIVREDSLQTTRDGVWAGGDAVTGAATVILAMGAGKQAAREIDEALRSNLHMA